MTTPQTQTRMPKELQQRIRAYQVMVKEHTGQAISFSDAVRRLLDIGLSKVNL